MTDVEELYQELVSRLKEYEQRFLKSHIPGKFAVGPEEYELDVKAYCLLSHAAFEEFFEQVALHVMKCAVEAWTEHRQATDVAIMLLTRYGLTYGLPDKDSDVLRDQSSVFDHIRRMLNQAKARFSKEIYNNHGMSPKYLVNLLTPVGIDFSPDPNTYNSLTQLAKQRSSYAHKGLRPDVMPPEDALNYVSDCLRFAEEIKNEAVSRTQRMVCDARDQSAQPVQANEEVAVRSVSQ